VLVYIRKLRVFACLEMEAVTNVASCVALTCETVNRFSVRRRNQGSVADDMKRLW